MLKIMKEHKISIAKLLTECFLDDELVIKQIKGIKGWRRIFGKVIFISIPYTSRNPWNVFIRW